MADNGNFGNTLEETVVKSSLHVKNASQVLASLVDQLHLDGQPRKLNEYCRQDLIDLSIKLEGLKENIEKFQNNVQEAYGFNAVELRTPKGRNQRDSGYGSTANPQSNTTSGSSSKRISQQARKSNQQLSKELSPRNKPTISDESSTDETHRKDSVPSFYLNTPPPSSTSLAGEEPDNPASDISNSKPEKQDENRKDMCTESNYCRLNNLSKPPSEEDNLKQSF